MLIHWIWLATRSSVNDRMKRALVEKFHDAEDVYHADADALRQYEGLSEEALASLSDKALHGAQKILAQCADKDIRILTLRDAAYPGRLRNIGDPPLVLYHKGRLPDLDSVPAIGVVGTRKATPYGLSVARRMGQQIARCGGVLVSGMAFGIDGVATGGALSCGGIAVGVLGSGVDVVYPAANRALFSDMERCGCLISEFPPETPPMKWNFPKRNRIISGLSDGVLVVEAPERSGALITARQALEQGRDVYVVPGNIDVASCAGSNALLRDGAMAVTSGWDILSAYEAAYPGSVHRDDTPPSPAEQEKASLKVAQTTRAPASEKKEIDNGSASPYIDGEKPSVPLTPLEQRIVDRLSQGACLIDEVIGAAGEAPGKVLAVLTMMEVKGIVRRSPGNMLALK